MMHEQIATDKSQFNKLLTRALPISALAFVALVGCNVAKAKSDYETFNCEPGNTVIINPGSTVWGEVAEPLAEELDITVDRAMNIVSQANPDVSLSNIVAGTAINSPNCSR